MKETIHGPTVSLTPFAVAYCTQVNALLGQDGFIPNLIPHSTAVPFAQPTSHRSREELSPCLLSPALKKKSPFPNPLQEASLPGATCQPTQQHSLSSETSTYV